MKQLYFFAVGVLLSACSQSEVKSDKTILAYSPVYITFEQAKNITFEADRKLRNSGKIYEFRNYLLISEAGAGVHIFDNKDPKNPKRLNFINIPGNQDMELRGNALFVDNALDLVAIDLSDIKNPKVKQRIANVFPANKYPPFENVKFECVDETKGYVVGWELKEVLNPKCSK